MFALIAVVGQVFAGTGGAFDYLHFNTWNGYCNNNGNITKQQSPVDIPLNKLEGSVDLTFTNFFRGKLSLSQHIKNTPDGNMAMILDFKHDNIENNPSSFFFQGVHYSLDHVHSHWGSSEHVIDGRRQHGSLHFVFKGDSPESRWSPLEASVAVIELMVTFVDEDDDEIVFKGFPRCPVPSLEMRERLDSVHCRRKPKSLNYEPELQDEASENVGTAFMAAMTRFRGKSGSMIHYVGSLTTPPCSGPVQWFVITEPLKLFDATGDWLGCDVFAASFPRVSGGEDMCGEHGNYRPPQDIKEMTTFSNVHIRYNKNIGKGSISGQKLKPSKQAKKNGKDSKQNGKESKPERFL